jgi:DNA-binding CsgD family transcriptional regulator
LIIDELTTQEISNQPFISPKTVETHRLNLLRNTAGLVKEAINQGCWTELFAEVWFL